MRAEVPGLNIGVRLSAFDIVPFEDDPATRSGTRKGVGRPVRFDHLLPYRYGFGTNQNNPLEYDLSEPIRFLEMLAGLGVTVVNITCGSPYYNPHIQRPAYFPPSDGYQPPEDPLVGVARQIDVVRQFKQRFPEMIMVGTGYTYLQEFLPQVGQAVVRDGWVDFVGSRADGAQLSGDADRLSSRPGKLDTKANLPDLQRLHDRASQGPDQRLLPAG